MSTDSSSSPGQVPHPDKSPFYSPGTGAVEADVNVLSTHAAVAREKGDFSVRNLPLSLWALLPICGVALFAGGFLSTNLAFLPNVKGFNYTPELPGGAAQVGPPQDEFDPTVWLAKGKAEYNNACAVCHGAGGAGAPGQFPPIAASEWVIKGDKRLVAIILHGAGGPLKVNGTTYNGAMPAWGATKSNKIIGQIASYIRQSFGNSASMVWDDQVAELRKELSTKATPYDEAELLAIGEDAALPPSKRGSAPDAAAAAAVPAAAPAAPAPAPAPAK